MSHRFWKSVLILLASTGCGGRQAQGPASPVPAPSLPPERGSDKGPWSFTYRSDTIHLQIARSAAIESETDSGPHREISTNNTHEILILAVNADTVHYSATVDSFFTAAQGRIGNVQAVSLPVQISGTLDSV